MLGGAQKQLEERFGALAAARAEQGLPVYAIEHGLTTDQLTSLRAVASTSIRLGSPSSDHWLVWAVLGAEAGYGYGGDEFWPALDVRDGEWRSNEDRRRLRTFYQRFAKAFRGPVPVGRWADHFSIIAWPISHSILPRYLQVAFAKHLYEVRHELAEVAHTDSSAIGRLLFKRYYGTSSRVRDFLQQIDLTSQIVIALRDEEVVGAVQRIEPATLRRIVGDLEKHGDARAYLSDTRKLIRSAHVRLAAQLQPAAQQGADGSGASGVTSSRFRLAAKRNTEGAYTLGLRYPDFSAIFRAAGIGKNELTGQQIKFSGDGTRTFPASNLQTLSGSERRLDHFPKRDEALVTPLDLSGILARVLAPVAYLEERSTWVLRRQASGLFSEVLGAHVRAGEDYLILRRTPVPSDKAALIGMASAELSASGVIAYKVNTPARLTEALRAAFQSIGVGSRVGITIQAAGLGPRLSDSVPAWLSTEPVILAVSSDNDIQTATLDLDGGPAQRIKLDGPVALVHLTELSLGRHAVTVTAGNGPNSFTAERFEFEIVTPAPWSTDVSRTAGFRLILEPDNATLEQLVSRRAKLHAFGPQGRTIQWSVRTYDAAGHAKSNGSLGNSRIGEAAASLEAVIEKLREKYSDEIDEANHVEIIASLDELGRQARSFPHVVDPLRWKFDPRTQTVRLIDETDHTEPLSVVAYALSKPATVTKFDSAQALAGFSPEPPGALLIAKFNSMRPAILVSTHEAAPIRDLAELGLAQNIELPSSSGESVARLIKALRRWRKAKPVGYLALVRRDSTVEAIEGKIASLCCGDDFTVLLRSKSPQALERAQPKVGGSQGFGFRMRTAEWPLDAGAAKATFCYYARHYRVEADDHLSTAALQLAFDPLSVRRPEGVEAIPFLDSLLANRPLLRGAFLVRTVALQGSDSQVSETA